MNKKTMVIAINSVSGGGKTTIARELADRLENSRAIYFKDYDVSKAKEENLEHIIIECVDYEQITGFIDLSVYIDTPLDIALAQRILRDYSKQGQVDSILKELDVYLHTRRTDNYSQAVNRNADLTVDGSLKTGEIVDIIIKEIEKIKGG